MSSSIVRNKELKLTLKIAAIFIICILPCSYYMCSLYKMWKDGDSGEFTSLLGDKDKNTYRKIVLSNGMKVIMIYKKDVKTSGAYLKIKNFGFSTDPEKYPGLNHLIKHIFSIIDKDSTKYKDFIEQVNGYSNSYIERENTSHFLYTPSNNFLEAFNLFSEFLKCSMLEKLTEDNYQIILKNVLSNMDEENKNHKENINIIQNKLMSLMIKPECLLSRFCTGSSNNLEDITKQNLLNLIHYFYYPEKMSLIVYSNIPMDIIKEHIKKCFLSFPNEKIEWPLEEEEEPLISMPSGLMVNKHELPVFKKDLLNNIVVFKSNTLKSKEGVFRIMFSLEPLIQIYDMRIHELICILIEDAFKLNYSTFKHKDLITSFHATADLYNSTTIFIIKIAVTDTNPDILKDISTHVCHCISTICNMNIKKIYEESKEKAEKIMKIMQIPGPSLLKSCSALMFIYSFPRLIKSAYIWQDPDMTKVDSMLLSLQDTSKWIYFLQVSSISGSLKVEVEPNYEIEYVFMRL